MIEQSLFFKYQKTAMLSSALRVKPNALVSQVAHIQSRNYASPAAGKSVLTKRIKRKLTPGKTRPSIFYQFECKVELSDGSTYTRRSQFPRVEWRYLADQRNNHLYNPSRNNLKAVESDATGKLAKFSQKFGFVEAESVQETEGEAEGEGAAQKEQVEPTKQSLMDDYLDIMGEGFVPVQSGGKLAGKKRGKK